MAVVFNNDGFTIEFKTNCNPIEDWLNTHDDLCDLLVMSDGQRPASGKNFYYAIELLRNMMPDYETARKMTEMQKK